MCLLICVNVSLQFVRFVTCPIRVARTEKRRCQGQERRVRRQPTTRPRPTHPAPPTPCSRVPPWGSWGLPPPTPPPPLPATTATPSSLTMQVERCLSPQCIPSSRVILDTSRLIPLPQECRDTGHASQDRPSSCQDCLMLGQDLMAELKPIYLPLHQAAPPTQLRWLPCRVTLWWAPSSAATSGPTAPGEATLSGRPLPPPPPTVLPTPVS